MYILYMLVLNNTPFVHARVYLQYLKSALPEAISTTPTIMAVGLEWDLSHPGSDCE